MATQTAVTTATVTINDDPTTGQPKSIDPVSTLQLFIGDSATWQIFGLPSDFVLLFNFNPIPPDLAPQGLFQEIFPSPCVAVVGNGSEMNFLLTHFFQPDDNVTEYSYNLSIKDPDGNFVVSVSKDPMIDSLGPPGQDGDSNIPATKK